MSYYFSSLLWHAAAFGQLLVAAVAAYWIAKRIRRLLAPAIGGSAVLLGASSATVALAAFLSLVVTSSYFMDRSFASHLAQVGKEATGQAACVSVCADGRSDSSVKPAGLEI